MIVRSDQQSRHRLLILRKRQGLVGLHNDDYVIATGNIVATNAKRLAKQPLYPVADHCRPHPPWNGNPQPWPIRLRRERNRGQRPPGDPLPVLIDPGKLQPTPNARAPGKAVASVHDPIISLFAAARSKSRRGIRRHPAATRDVRGRAPVSTPEDPIISNRC